MSALRSRLASLLLAFTVAPLAEASSDSSCLPDWRLERHELDGCSSLAALVPGNDSRVNLFWLLADQGVLPAGVPALPAENAAYGYGEVPFDLRRLLPRPQPDLAGDVSVRPQDELDQTLAAQIAALGLQAEFPQRFAPDPWPLGDGSRCRSNDRQTASAFIAQLQLADLTPEEQQQLARRRLQLLTAFCPEGEAAAALLEPLPMTSPSGQAFAAYLLGSAAFYAGAFDVASQRFHEAAMAEEDWLAETSRYLLARTSLNAAQAGMLDEWGFFDLARAEQPALLAAEQGFNAYLANWPQGRYAASARGLLRKVYWLQGRQPQLSHSYGAAFAQPLDAAQAGALIAEMDDKLLMRSTPDRIEQPLLLAVSDLMAMRGTAEPRLTLEQLQGQRGLFAGREALHDYLLAAHALFVAGDAEASLRQLPAARVPDSYLAFSREMLRGLALQKLGRSDEARAHWQQLIGQASQPLQREQVELALALNMERAGQLDALFAADSPLRTQALRDRLLRLSAGRELLRARVAAGDASEAPLALFVLLYRELLQGDYQGFLEDLPKLAGQPLDLALTTRLGEPPYARARSLQLFQWGGGPGREGYDCPSLAKVAGRLAKHAGDAQGLLCLGEFVRRNGLDSLSLRQPATAGSPGSSGPGFSAPLWSRLDGYLGVMADRKASREQQAYALYRAIHCFAPGGNNSCGSQEVAQDQRKRWFATLKRHYADTRWAQQLRYWW